MQYDFDRKVDHRNTNSIKWEYVVRNGVPARWEQTDPALGVERVLPMRVADMDFPTSQAVIDALTARVAHGIFGYSAPAPSYYEALRSWFEPRQGWTIEADWVVPTPGVVTALHLLVRAFVAPGEKALVQPPVYRPFYLAITNNGAEIVRNPLILEDGRYRMDFDDLAQKLDDPAVKLAILCSPHNPIGRVWRRDELQRFAELCLARGVTMVSDEIHGDLIFPGQTFTPFASLGDQIAANCIVCTAPSKTFNLAGLASSNIIIPDADLRARFQKTMGSAGIHGINTLGITATEAAYSHGAEWLDQVMAYIAGNYATLEALVRERLPQLGVTRPEGTYLVWLDCRRLGLKQAELERLLLDEARVYVEQGSVFGPEGEGFVRMNIACPRSSLVEAWARIEAAVGRLPAL